MRSLLRKSFEVVLLAGFLLGANFVPAGLPATGGLAAGKASTSAIPTLEDFANSLKNGQAGQVVGLYVPQVLALQVVQQPAADPSYVSQEANVVTQFGLAAQYGTTGLLAHNYLSGALFFNLSSGEEVDIVYGDGAVRGYSILAIGRFQALNPSDPASSFIDLDDASQLSSTDLFYRMYGREDRVVLQTCIEANGDPSWGRLFVIAIPLSSPYRILPIL